jgi:uncharacterized tellurite resistance protein B-like protein
VVDLQDGLPAEELMLRAIKRALGAVQGEIPAVPGHERRQLQVAVAVLLHEARRADPAEADGESAAGELALADLFGLERQECAALLAQGRAKAEQLTSFYAPVSVIKRDFDLPERIRLVEHLWRVSFADGELSLYEDHYVRKIAHLLYVPNTQSMLARNRARG